jgi:hypothetical protein
MGLERPYIYHIPYIPYTNSLAPILLIILCPITRGLASKESGGNVCRDLVSTILLVPLYHIPHDLAPRSRNVSTNAFTQHFQNHHVFPVGRTAHITQQSRSKDIIILNSVSARARIRLHLQRNFQNNMLFSTSDC